MSGAAKAAVSARSGTPEAILAAARRRYARFGPRKTTMAELAREAGCSRATLYTHFPGKAALYTGLLEAETREFLRELEASVASSRGARQKLREILQATARIYAGNPVLCGALTGDDEMTLHRVAQPVVAIYEKRVIGLLRRVLEAGIAEGSFRKLDAEAVAYLMYRLGGMLVTRELAGYGDFPLERILAVMDDVIARGIARPRPTAGSRREKAR